MSIRTPLARVRGLGSAHDGTGDFWRQRLTAVSNLVLITVLVVLAVALVGRPYAQVVSLLGSLPVTILAILAVISVTYHMRIGMQVIIEDYVHHKPTKIALIMANTFYAVVIAFASIFAILKISFGA